MNNFYIYNKNTSDKITKEGRKKLKQLLKYYEENKPK